MRYSSQNVVPCCLGGPDNNRREFVVMESWPRKFQYRPRKEITRSSIINPAKNWEVKTWEKEIQEERELIAKKNERWKELASIFAEFDGMVAPKRTSNGTTSTKIVQLQHTED